MTSVRRLLIVSVILAPLSSCATDSNSVLEASESVLELESTCAATDLRVTYISEGTEEWTERIESSARAASAIFNSVEFQQECRSSTMTRRREKSVQQVCSEFSCSGPRTIKVGLYNDPSVRVVAFEKSGAVFINTAKTHAGSPGNIAHEFAHTLGYSHSTNWGFIRKRSVPYVIGGLVRSFAEQSGRAAPSAVPIDVPAARP